jgi:phosphoenolpyruvate synthase/pyruvate phosphate dikinase
MVFGNMGDTSATGVAFTRDPATGENAYYGEFLINAQGEDVVAGIRTPQYLTKAARERANAKPLSMEEAMPEVYGQLADVFRILETHYRDMQDIEFTVERGKLWMLQTRSGKRTAKAALKIAVDMANEGLITQNEAILRVEPSALDQLLHPTLDPTAKRDVLTKGLPASPGAASGLIVFTQDERIRRKLRDEAALMEHETMVDVVGRVSPEALARLNATPIVDGRAMLSAKVSISRQTDALTGLRFAIKGCYPGQIAQMCETAGLTVSAVRRIRIGRLPVAGLPMGQWRYLLAYEKF